MNEKEEILIIKNKKNKLNYLLNKKLDEFLKIPYTSFIYCLYTSTHFDPFSNNNINTIVAMINPKQKPI